MGFWLVRLLVVAHHMRIPYALQTYLNEYAWRYSHRDDERAMFETLLLRAVGS